MKHIHIDPELLPRRQNLLRGLWIRWFIIAIITVITVVNLQALFIPATVVFAVIGAFALYNLVVHYMAAAHKLSRGFVRVMFASTVPLAPLLDIGIILFLVLMTGGIDSEFFYVLILRIIYSAATSTVRSVFIQTAIATIGYLVVIAVMNSDVLLIAIPDILLRLGVLWPSFFIVSFINRERNLNIITARELDRRLRLLLELSSWINRAKDLSEILDFATRASYSLVKGASSSTVLILSEDEKYLRVRANTGLSPAEMDELITVGIPIEKGIVGLVARTGKPEILPDVKQDPRYLHVRGDINSEMTVPIITEGKVLGVFNLESTERNAFSQDDLRYMETLCDIVAVAINNQKLYTRLETQIKTLTALVEVSNTMISSIGEDVLEFINLKAKELLNCDHATIFMLDEEGSIRARVSSSPDREAFLAVRMRPGAGVTGSVIASGKPRLVADSTSVSERVLVPGTEDVPESMICVPLILRDKIMGAILVNKSNVTNFFTEEDLKLLELFANLAAAAIESSEAFRTEKQRREALEAAMKLQTTIMDNITNALKTPLANILSYIEVLRTEQNITAEDSARYLLNAEAQAKRLDTTLDRILFTSRLASHQVQVVPERVFLRMLVLEIRENYLKELESQHITFNVDCPNKSISVLQDEALLRKLLQDFLDNAIVYNNEGGLVDVKLEELDGYVRATITDTGNGLPPGFKENLLVALSTDGDRRSAGLGLYSSMLVAELLSIKVGIESSPGLGTTISLDIYPLKQESTM